MAATAIWVGSPTNGAPEEHDDIGEALPTVVKSWNSVGSACSAGLRARRGSSVTCTPRSGGTTLRVHRPAPGGSIMSKDSTAKANVKKKGKTIKEKQTAKRLKRDEQNGRSSNIVSTGR
ncbi:hypothetical protein [Micromonospora sp. NPDC005237]|uniref:hypothetical protein n=1 Tax=Micromonospora sp. NPDC005237 TaxID=3155113 RepID=UPI0033AAA208